MCTLALYFQVFDDFPVLVAANRDEHYDRPARVPMALNTHPRVVAGTDVRAGGTWLGVNERGVLAAILNRRSDEATDGPTRSRGLLCLDVLACESAAAARDFLAIQREPYQPFTIVIVDSRNAWFGFNTAGHIETRELTPGLHVFSNAAIHDDASEKRQRAYGLFAKAQPGAATFSCADSWIGEFQRALSDHTLGYSTDDPKEAICVHGEVSGTVSSSIVLLSNSERHFRTLYCPGAPCRTRFSEAPSLNVL
jgi:uncharacterized protein with NRDE domain